MSENCIHCGDSCAFGSGKYVNRIPVCDDLESKKEAGYAYPEGEYICIDCEVKWYKEYPQFECKTCGNIDYVASRVDGECTSLGCKGTEWVLVDPEP